MTIQLIPSSKPCASEKPTDGRDTGENGCGKADGGGPRPVQRRDLASSGDMSRALSMYSRAFFP